MVTSELTEKLLTILTLLVLILCCVWITAPFLRALAWATVIVVTGWPVYRQLRSALKGHGYIAAALLTFSLLLTLFVPVLLLGNEISASIADTDMLTRQPLRWSLPTHPSWLDNLPLVGSRLAQSWEQVRTNPGAQLAKLQPYLQSTSQWFLQRGAAWGMGVLDFIAGIIASAVLFAKGDMLVRLCHRLMQRLAPANSLELLKVAEATIRGVTLGVVGTAIIQALLTSAGLMVAGVPGVVVLGVLSFLSATLQIGTVVVWLPVAVWLSTQDQYGWMTFTIVWGLFINTIDNFIKPYLLGQDSKTPALLSFIGITGGFLAWGIIGMFLGATLIALAYRLLDVWLKMDELADKT